LDSKIAHSMEMELSSNVMDALIIVDLTQTSQTLLERYMGGEGADSFLRFRNLVSYRACA